MPTQWFGQARNVELSTIAYIETQINANWTGVTVVKGFPNRTKVSPPVIAVRMVSNNATRREIGSTTMLDVYNLIIDIFATSDGMRLDLAQLVQDTVTTSWTYNTHANPSGGGETLDTVAAGTVQFREFTQNQKLDFVEDVEAFDRFRHILAFNVWVGK